MTSRPGHPGRGEDRPNVTFQCSPVESHPATTPARCLYRILVRDLMLKCSIGIYEHERLAPQRVRINVDMSVLEQAAGPANDDIANVLSYEDVIEGIRRLLAEGHINLVETLAEKIASLCLEDERVEMARVRVEKPDVYAEAASVGIEIERYRAR
ncbi:dihydroneopterin aldolase [Magnetospirillum molischianum]|uniref:7,8-dihydroneopterin aldolase n=1 Tax=Magnetospirillum molischianum DSM 120 TaxID=1150626 RepID=H8FPD7_MAGML|nr:Dihydroneopterin aldolase [Magnetospirillum molischianum DSM 120]